jgi:hypothetical protein
MMATIRSALESSNGPSASVKRMRPNCSTLPKSDGGEARRRPLAMGGRGAHDERHRGDARGTERERARGARDLTALVVRRGRVGTEQHDDEDEEDDDGARVDDELDRGEELRVQREVDAGDAHDHHQEAHRTANGVLGDDGGDRADDG